MTFLLTKQHCQSPVRNLHVSITKTTHQKYVIFHTAYSILCTLLLVADEVQPICVILTTVYSTLTQQPCLQCTKLDIVKIMTCNNTLQPCHNFIPYICQSKHT